MQEIRLGSTDSVFSVNKENTVHIELDNTSKNIPITDVQAIVDQYEIYRTEASACNKYRLTLTMKPYCTNVLFNTCTEIVYNEGDSDRNQRILNEGRNGTAKVATDDIDLPMQSCFDVIDNSFGIDTNKINGLIQSTSNVTLNRAYMVDNTEYSSKELYQEGKSSGFTYHPGYDIFGNHILRNLSFRSVIPIIPPRLYQTDPKREIYNTIEDTMRDMYGNVIKHSPRFSPSDINRIDKHLYEKTNLLSMKESVAANLTNENGWFGFYNNSSIVPKKIERTQQSPTERESNHVINNRGNCEFIDMYPDRTLYSFTPKLNTFKHRMEKNWDVFITYPYKNFYRHNLVTNVYASDVESEHTRLGALEGDQQTNALLLLEAKSQYCRNGMDGVQFRSYCKHNLNPNDRVIIYYSMDGGVTFKACENNFRVNYIGDMKNENKDYFFTITNSSILDEIFEGRIESIFYDESTTLPVNYREVNGEITDIPQELDTDDSSYVPDILKWFYISLPTVPLVTWDNSNTVDVFPADVINGPTYIRKRIKDANNEYVYNYYEYTGGTYQMLPPTFDITSQTFGDGNTFDNVPVDYVTDYIRVHTYNYYTKTSKYYTQKTEKIRDIVNNLLCNYIPIRFSKIVGSVKCKYYLRLFKKLPNLNRKREDLNNRIATNEIMFGEYVQRNATKNGKMRDFEREVYPLAFSKTIYGDDITQYQFTETMDIAYIRDNLNRPLTQLYVTIVKRNKGYKEWYLEKKYGDYDDEKSGYHQIECSHCFGKVTSGLDYLCLDDDDSLYYRTNKAFISDARLINNSTENIEVGKNGMSLECWREGITPNEYDTCNTEGVLECDEVFFGDVVEYDSANVRETVLSDVQFRFNTAQREIGNVNEYTFTYKEITTDDDDIERFHTEKYTKDRDLLCPEGYYYKAHYPIGVRAFGDGVKQASHYSVSVDTTEPVQMEGIFIRVYTKNNHKYRVGRKVFICNDADGVWYNSSIVYVDSKKSFIIKPISRDVEAYEGKPYFDWIQTCNYLNEGIFRIRVANEDIPDYADNVSTNIFLWREIIPAIESNDEVMSAYPFANGALYIDKCINFFLKRQDPDAINGLYYIGKFPDVEGKIRFESNYEYIPEPEFTC